MRDELDRSLSFLQGTEPIGRLDGDAADAGASLSENDRTQAMLSTVRNQRDCVLAALDRIEQSRYGRCVDCGHEIPEGRLEARPDAARCVPCQAKHARRNRFLCADTISWAPWDSSGLARSSARTRAGMHAGSRRSAWWTMDGDIAVSGRIQSTVRPAPVNSSCS